MYIQHNIGLGPGRIKNQFLIWLFLKRLKNQIARPEVKLINNIYYIDTDEIPGFLLLLKNHIFTARSEDTRELKLARFRRRGRQPEVSCFAF